MSSSSADGPYAKSQPSVGEDLEAIADSMPSQGGHKLSTLLRKLAREAPDGTSVVEVGAWMGAGTAQLALGLLERDDPRSADLNVYDRFWASDSEVVKLRKAGVQELSKNDDTLPWIRNRLAPIEAKANIKFVKGSIFDAQWDPDKAISVYVDDLSKGNFTKVAQIFGPGWRPHITILLLMDFHYYKKNDDPKLRAQKEFVDAHPECFEVIHDIPGGTSTAAFRYLGGLDFDNLT